MNAKLYLQIVTFALVAHGAQAGITMSRSKAFGFLCDDSAVQHIPEENKSIKYFKGYGQFESLDTFLHLYGFINTNDSCFRASCSYFFGCLRMKNGKSQQALRDDFDKKFIGADRFPYNEWLALGCSQTFELRNPMPDEDKKVLQEINDMILKSSKFGSLRCDSIQEQAVDMGSGDVDVVDIQNLSVKKTLEHGKDAKLLRIIYNPDGTELATQAENGMITFWDTKTGLRTRTIPASPLLACLYLNKGKEFVFSPDGYHWRVLRWAAFKKFERNDYSIEKCRVIKQWLDEKIKAVNNNAKSDDLDAEITELFISDENDAVNYDYDESLNQSSDSEEIGE